MRQSDSPIASICASFASGAVAGVIVIAGTAVINPDNAALLFDWSGNGLDWSDALLPGWLMGNAATVLHHILPGIARA